MFQAKSTFTLAAVAVFAGLVVSSAQAAIQIGPGASLAGVNAEDTHNQERLNVALSSSGDDFVNLAAGTYNVVDFRLDVRVADTGGNNEGTVAPMLLTGSSGSWTTLWVGGDFDPTSTGVQTAATYAAGTETFTLAVATDVYAGIFTKNQGSAIPGINLGIGKTDHDGNGFTAPTGPGDTVNGFSHANLTRAYAFEVNIDVIPEPASLALLGLGGLVLLRRRRA